MSCAERFHRSCRPAASSVVRFVATGASGCWEKEGKLACRACREEVAEVAGARGGVAGAAKSWQRGDGGRREDDPERGGGSPMESSSAEAGNPQPRPLHCFVGGWPAAGAAAGGAGGTCCDGERPLESRTCPWSGNCSFLRPCLSWRCRSADLGEHPWEGRRQNTAWGHWTKQARRIRGCA
eukprot:6478757-Amphidinium_carterae.1